MKMSTLEIGKNEWRLTLIKIPDVILIMTGQTTNNDKILIYDKYSGLDTWLSDRFLKMYVTLLF